MLQQGPWQPAWLPLVHQLAGAAAFALALPLCHQPAVAAVGDSLAELA